MDYRCAVKFICELEMELLDGHTTRQGLRDLLGQMKSKFSDGPLEGVVIRREDEEWLQARAKLVRPDFAQAIDAHWRSRRIELNHRTFENLAPVSRLGASAHWAAS